MIKKNRYNRRSKAVFFSTCKRGKPEFFPDDDFADYINLENKESVYSEEEVQFRNQQMEKCFDICEQFGADISELMGQPLFEKIKLGEYAEIT